MLVLSRRRRGRFSAADTALRRVLGDAALIGWYDTRFPSTIDATAVGSWSDARGSGYGPALAQSTSGSKPTFDPAALTITFDGTDDYLRAVSSVWNTITAAAALVLVGTMPDTGASFETMVAAGTSGNASIMRLGRGSSNSLYTVTADSDLSPSATKAAAAGRRVMHGRITASSGGNVTVGARVGSASEATASGASNDATWNSLTVGANNAGTAAGFADTIVRAVLAIKGTYSTAQQDAVNEWANAVHGVTL